MLTTNLKALKSSTDVAQFEDHNSKHKTLNSVGISVFFISTAHLKQERGVAC